jgi:hypothetical protein
VCKKLGQFFLIKMIFFQICTNNVLLICLVYFQKCAAIKKKVTMVSKHTLVQIPLAKWTIYAVWKAPSIFFYWKYAPFFHILNDDMYMMLSVSCFWKFNKKKRSIIIEKEDFEVNCLYKTRWDSYPGIG